MRAFSTDPGDLDLEFSQLPRPQVVTQVLRACLSKTESGDPSAGTWEWSVAQRLPALLAVVLKTCGRQMPLTTRCEGADCREQIELPLDLTVFQQPSVSTVFSIAVEDGRLTMRLPNGHDQLKWSSRKGKLSFRDMAGDLVVAYEGVERDNLGSVPERWLNGISEALEAQDPLTALQMNSQCPSCDRSLTLDVDLEGDLSTCSRTFNANCSTRSTNWPSPIIGASGKSYDCPRNGAFFTSAGSMQARCDEPILRRACKTGATPRRRTQGHGNRRGGVYTAR